MSYSIATRIGQVEDRIIGKIARRALAAGYLISVRDEEEEVVPETSDESVILDGVGHTDATTFVFWKDGVRAGFCWFVHGNDEDVVTDCSDTEEVLKLTEV